jgi:predicted Zn-dependent protease
MSRLLMLLLVPLSAVAGDLPRSDSCQADQTVRLQSHVLLDEGDPAREAGDTATARERYRAALDADACNAPAWSRLGAILLDAGEHELAAEALVTASFLDSDSARPWLLLARAQEATGSDPSYAYQRALEALPGLPAAVDGLRRHRTAALRTSRSGNDG